MGTAANSIQGIYIVAMRESAQLIREQRVPG